MYSVIGFTGRMGSGKTTLANYITSNKFMSEAGIDAKYTKVSFATPLKDVVKYLFDLDNEQLYGSTKNVVDPRYGVTPRYLLQYIGTDLFRNWDKDFWVKTFQRKYSNVGNIVLDDVRFENEADILHQMGGIVIKVVRYSQSHSQAEMRAETRAEIHASEKGIKNYDYKIYNNGSYVDLMNSLHELLHYIKCKQSNNNEDNQPDE